MPVDVVTTASCMLWLHMYCDHPVAAQESWAVCASKAFRYPCLGLMESPHLITLYAFRARHAALALSGNPAWCCLGLSYSLTSVACFTS